MNAFLFSFLEKVQEQAVKMYVGIIVKKVFFTIWCSYSLQAASDFLTSPCWFDLIFGHPVGRCKGQRISKADVKPTVRSCAITCCVEGVFHDLVFLLLAGGKLNLHLAMLVGALQYKIRMMGILIPGPSYVYCDNNSVVMNSKAPASTLKKKSNFITYHAV
jgi:hypothetical protein